MHNNFKYKNITKDLVLIALSIAFITVSSWIIVPLIVPISLQTLAIFVVVGILGPFKGAIAIAIYLLMGLIGVPVFSSFNAGISAYLGPTGGFLLGFLIVPICFYLFSKLHFINIVNNIIAMVVSLLLIYLVGSLWFTYVFNTGSVDYFSSLLTTVVPFIFPDILKIVVASILIARLSRLRIINGQE